MHRIPFVSIPLLVLLAPALAAQEAVPKPSPELQKFAPQIGTWEGSGTVKHGADGPEAKWTATTSAKWVLGGFAVREDTRVDFDGMEQPLVMVTLFGWDGENKRPVALTASKLGAVGMTEVHWGASGERITADVQQMAGKLVVARWVHRIDGDTCHLSCQEAADDGAFYTHVDGTMTRKSEKPSDVTLVDAAFMPEYAQSSVSHFERLKPAAGTYRMKGWFKMGPGAPKTDFSGTEEFRMVFGGSVFEVNSKGDATAGMPAYEALGWMGWDDHDGCYKMVFANNMGEIGEQDCRFDGDATMVTTNTCLHMGNPTVTRGLIQLGDDGAFRHYTADMVIGTAKPEQMFECTYEKQ